MEETCYWLELLADAESIKRERLTDLQTEADELSAILTTCIKNAKQKEAKQ